MIEPSLNTLSLYASFLEGSEDLLCDLPTPHVGIFLLVVVLWKAIETGTLLAMSTSIERSGI